MAALWLLVQVVVREAGRKGREAEEKLDCLEDVSVMRY